MGWLHRSGVLELEVVLCGEFLEWPMDDEGV